MNAFHLDILHWVTERFGKEEPGFLVGVNGPQGCGKTTLTTSLCALLAERGKKAITVSVDDFYLTRAEQIELAEEHSRNPYLQQRGYPGTHDIDLGARVLRTLKARDMEVVIPRYDKSLHEGQGDRLPESEWTRVEKPADIVFVEGWMLGFTPVPESTIKDNALREVNELLKPYTAWYRLLDAFLQLEPEDPLYVVDWRIEAEQRMRASGKPGMSDKEIRAYVEKFLPAYELYLPNLDENPPLRRNRLRVRIGKNRLPIA